MKILLLGSGGRENALAWKIVQSPECDELFIAPGNPGTALLGTNLSLKADDFEGIKNAVIHFNIGFVISGPEDPIAKGIADFFRSDEVLKHIPILAPTADAGKLESSKDFAKQFMMKYGIPTAKYQSFSKSQRDEAIAYITSYFNNDKQLANKQIVLKADGLAAGKGVVICNNGNEAQDFLDEIWLEGRFGASGDTVVIEEFLTGIELSVFVLTDGHNYILLPEAKDYKRIGEGDTGPNTGGMGSISPVPFATPEFMEKIKVKIIEPTMKGIQKENLDFRGFIFFGLIAVDQNTEISNNEQRTTNNETPEPFVIEYNVRMGDPETESVMPRIKSDLVPWMYKAAKKELETTPLEFDGRHAACVIAVSGGYPADFEKGKKISGVNDTNNSIVFHAGTKEDGGNMVTSGGRVLAVTSLADTLAEAINQSYQSISKINFEGMYYRRDIGFEFRP